jgi:hypothetical protein
VIQQSVFRKVSLDRLASPEQLDQVMQVTDPKGWIALLALGGVLVTAIVWGILGSIPEKVAGLGILVKSGGVLDVIAAAGGSSTAFASGGGSSSTTVVKSQRENVGRNDPCWCGSGKKYKKCHGA